MQDKNLCGSQKQLLMSARIVGVLHLQYHISIFQNCKHVWIYHRELFIIKNSKHILQKITRITKFVSNISIPTISLQQKVVETRTDQMLSISYNLAGK